MSNAPTPVEEGYGCRSTALTFALLAVFVVVAGTIGVSMALGPTCAGACEAAGFALYGAALPISAIFAVVAGELPIAWPLDATFWLIVAFVLGRMSERANRSIPRVIGGAIVVALIFGATVSVFLAANNVG